MSDTRPPDAGNPSRTYISWRQAAFIGVGSMVGAGIFSLLGPAGEVAGAAVWVSFLIAGAIAALQGYSFAKFGARYPSAAGLIEYVSRGFSRGHVTGVTAWMTFSVNTIVTGMVASSFGSYASALFTGGNGTWSKIFAALVVLAMSAVNIAGSKLVARAQALVVYVVLSILVMFAVIMLANMNRALLAPSSYPPPREIVSSVALTFFAFLGFGIVTFTAKDLKEPSRELPRAMYLAIGIATVIYVAIALGVFGTLPVDQVISAGATALAVAAQPTLGPHFVMPLAGMAIGAATGALVMGKVADFGIDDKFIKEVGSQITPGSSALFLYVAQVATDKVIERLQPYEPTVLHTSLSHDAEEKLRASIQVEA